MQSRRTSCPRSSSSRVNGTRRGAGSATCSRWRTSDARSSSSGSLTGQCTWHSASSRTCAKIRQRRQHQRHRRMKLQDNVRAAVVKEVQLRDPVTRSLRVRCTAAPAPAPAPVALPSTAHCPASGDHPPTSMRPPPTTTAIRAAAARRPTDCGARARRPHQRGQHQQGLRSERRAARRPQTMGPGPGLVAHVLWRYCMRLAASVIGCWRRAAGAASLRTAPDAPPPHLMMLAASRTSTRHRHSYQYTITLAAPVAHPQHPMTLAACNTATRHVPPALALAPYIKMLRNRTSYYYYYYHTPHSGTRSAVSDQGCSILVYSTSTSICICICSYSTYLL